MKLKIASEEQRIVWAEVYIPNVPDTDGDFMDAEGIRKMAYGFMQNMRQKQADIQHNNQLIEGACAVESFIARKGDPDFIEGAWVVGMHIPDDEAWAKVKKGELNGFSMEALVNKKQVEIEIDIPPVVRGLCIKAEDGHEHEYFVSFNDKGEFMGGRTSIQNGHYHPITKGTITDEAAGHAHRFSYTDILSQLKPVEV